MFDAYHIAKLKARKTVQQIYEQKTRINKYERYYQPGRCPLAYLPYSTICLIMAYISAADSMGLSSFNFSVVGSERASFLQYSAYRPFKVIQGR